MNSKTAYTNDTPCDDLPLPARARMAVQIAGIHTLGELRKRFAPKLLHTTNFGRASYKAIEEFLDQHPDPDDQNGSSFWQARAESSRFFFEAYGSTEEKALEALHEGFKIHARQYRLEPLWYREAVDISTQEINFGAAYRDHQPLQTA